MGGVDGVRMWVLMNMLLWRGLSSGCCCSLPCDGCFLGTSLSDVL